MRNSKSKTAIFIGGFSLIILIAGTGCDEYLNIMAQKHFLAGNDLAAKGQPDEAMTELNLAVSIDPSHAEAWETMGDIRRKQNNWTDAKKYYLQSCGKDPYKFRPQYHLGLSYQKLASAEKSKKKSRGFILLATKAYLRALEISENDYDTFVNIGCCYFLLGKNRLCEGYFRKAIKLNPSDGRARYNLAVFLESCSRLDESAIAYKDAVELLSDPIPAVRSLARIYVQQKLYARASSVLNTLTRMTPDEYDVWNQAGICRFRAGRFDDALHAFRRAASINPKSPQAHRGIGVVLMSRYVKHTEEASLRDEAIDAWKKSLEIKNNQKDLQRLIAKYSPKNTDTQQVSHTITQ